MTTILLVRHGLCDPVGRSIAGRAPGVHLNRQGIAQAQELAERLAGLPIGAVYSSPLERARETATPLARRLELEVQEAPGLVELDFGDWTGRSLTELEGDPDWWRFNAERGRARIPGGETMGEVIVRAAGTLDRLHRRHPDALVMAVSHGDVIRGLLASYLGMPVDLIHRLEVVPASVSVVEMDAGVRVGAVNWRVPGPV